MHNVDWWHETGCFATNVAKLALLGFGIIPVDFTLHNNTTMPL